MYYYSVFLKLLSILNILRGNFGTHVDFEECGANGSIEYVDVNPCPTQPCVVKRGTNVTLTTSFTSKVATDTCNAVVYGIVYGVPVPWPLPNPDGCKDTGVRCPITIGSKQTYTMTIYINKEYPAISLFIKWQLQTPDKQPIFCFKVPAMVE